MADLESTDLEVTRAEVGEPRPAEGPVLPHRLASSDDLRHRYLVKFRPATCSADQTDLASRWSFCDNAGVEVLRAGIHHADNYLRLLDEIGDPKSHRTLSAATITRRISAISGFYRYARRQRALAESPFEDIDRPEVTPNLRPPDSPATSSAA